jgi:hypothetical protein
MALLSYHPEMHEPKPVALIEASLSHYGKHYFLDTPLELKGRGVEFLGVYKASDLCPVPAAQRKVGWRQYKVTLKAFDRIKDEQDVSYEMLLD